MELQTLPLYIDHTGGISIAQLAARARRLKRQKGLHLLIVDYLQLLSGSAKRSAEGRVQEVSEITVGLTKVEEHQKWQDEMDQVQGLAEVVIGKQRHGPTGSVRLQFQSEITRFGDLADDRRLPERYE